LAHHLTAAGDTEHAVDQWLKAGQFAAGRSAHLEALRHFDRGLAILASLSEKASRDRREAELQLARGLSLLTAKGFSSTEAVQSYTRARDLCEKSGDSDQLFVALWNLWLTTAVRDIDAARPLSNQLLVLTKTGAHSALRLQAHHSAWFTRFVGGEPSAALSHCDEGRHLYNIDQHRSLASLYGGHDPGVCALQTGALSTWLLGYPDKALASIIEAVNLADRLGHPFSLAFALLYQVVLYLFRREPEVALRRAHEAEAFAVEQRLALLLDPNILRGKAFLAQGAVGNAVESVREGVAARQKTGWDLHPPYHLGIASEVLGDAGDYVSAAAALAEAEMAIDASNERWWEAEVHRLKGVLLLSQGNAAQSESCFKRSIRIARKQQASSLELRAATSLARLWGDQGRRAEARDLLAPVYGWFTEGFDTADLKDAATLLSDLA
jgi:predicted ATPase